MNYSFSYAYYKKKIYFTNSSVLIDAEFGREDTV
jgi:hypothetical protein